MASTPVKTIDRKRIAELAKREETRLRRLTEAVRVLACGEKLGLK